MIYRPIVCNPTGGRGRGRPPAIDQKGREAVVEGGTKMHRKEVDTRNPHAHSINLYNTYTHVVTHTQQERLCSAQWERGTEGVPFIAHFGRHHGGVCEES